MAYGLAAGPHPPLGPRKHRLEAAPCAGVRNGARRSRGGVQHLQHAFPVSLQVPLK